MITPIKRVHFSNEKLQALLFLGIVINLVPGIIYRVYLVPNFIIGLIVTLIVDTIINFVRYKRVICSVSSSITFGVIFYLSPGIPFISLIISAISGVILGKHIWGGTGKNPINPGVLGLVITTLLGFRGYEIIGVSPLLIVLIPFVKLRIIPVISVLLSYTILYTITGNFYPASIFISFAVFTDPVTIRRGLKSGIIIFVINTALLYITDNIFIPILVINTVLEVVYRSSNGFFKTKYRPLKLKKLINSNKFPDTILKFNIPDSIDGSQFIDLIKDNKIVGQGGGGFPLYEKISSLGDKRLALIINSVECDPGLIHDSWILETYREELEKAAILLKEALGFKDLIFGAKASYLSKEVSYYKVPDYYPVGWENFLVKEVLGIYIEENKRATDYGVLVLNVQTLLNISKILSGLDLDSKYITVGDLNSCRGEIREVKIGGIIQDGYRYYGGGVFYSSRLREEESFTSKVNSIYKGIGDRFKNSVQCSRCDLCSLHCPRGLDPNRVDIDSCIKCGSCSYICLAGKILPLE